TARVNLQWKKPREISRGNPGKKAQKKPLTKRGGEKQYASHPRRKKGSRKATVLCSRRSLAARRYGRLYRSQKQRFIRPFLVTHRINGIEHRPFRFREAPGKQKSRPEPSVDRLIVVACRSHFSTS